MVNQTIICVVILGSATNAQGDPQSHAKLVRDWVQVCSTRAKAYEIYRTDKADAKFELLPEPIFYHNQPVRGNDIGALYVWVQEGGRPGVVGAIFGFSTSAKDGSRTVFHEMHSLAAVPVTAVWRGQTESIRAALQWKPLPDAPLPADTPEQRLRQARWLSRQFRGHSIDRRNRRWELRLISRPLYHYEIENDDSILAGALFAFCQGTDTEIVLWMEARHTAEGYRWHYACADFSDYGLYLRLDETDAWSSPGSFMSGLKWTSKSYRVRLPEDRPTTRTPGEKTANDKTRRKE